MNHNAKAVGIDRDAVRDHFLAITGVTLSSETLRYAVKYGYPDAVFGWINAATEFRDALRSAFGENGLGCDMRKKRTWEALERVIGQFYECRSSRVTGEGVGEREGKGEDETPLEVWHLDDPNWRDERIMQMSEWHPFFREVEPKLRWCVALAEVALEGYADLLMKETKDEPDYLLAHLDEEVIDWITRHLIDSVKRVWKNCLVELMHH
ncbi:MAG: hypothetical protein KME45_27135 [Stenomitos rutilans HA7619-LM2]|jgi:hypothetical protein|nr:hypothetical protein [Stenomitos rutilans HA7619-LM2]